MWTVEESRALAVALDNLSDEELQAGLDAILREGAKPESDIEALPDNVQAVIPPLEGAEGVSEPETDGTPITAAGGPDQARAPRGTPIGGEWIPTPAGILGDLVRAQGGASIDPLTGLQPTTGYMVAVQGHNREVPEDDFFGAPGEDAMYDWIEEKRDVLSQPGSHIGLWHDTANREVVLDVSQQVDDLDEAIRLGQERNQQAVWDVANGVEIPTGGTGDRQASAAQPYRMDDHDRHHPNHRGPEADRGFARGLLRVARGAEARVHPGRDQRAAPGRVAFAAADQARAPKGTPQGGQWIDTPAGLARQIRGINLAVEGLGKPIGEPQSLDDMDNDYTALVSAVNPGYLDDPNDQRFNQNCQRVVGAVEMRARGFDAAGNAYDGTRDDTIAIEDCWTDPQTGSVRLFAAEVPPNQALRVISTYPVGSRFIMSGWSEDEQFGHVWNAEITPTGFLEVDGQGGSAMGLSIFDTFDQVQWLRVDDLTPTDKMLGGTYPMITTPDNQRAPGLNIIGAAAPLDPVQAGAAAGFEVIEARDLGTEVHLIVANPVHKFSDSLLVMDKTTGEVHYVSRFTHPAVQTEPEETTP